MTQYATQYKNQQGTTLIELILYIGLLAIFLSGAILFSWNVILSKTKSNTQRQVMQNARLASERISYEIRNASSVISLSSTNLCLSSPNVAHNPTRIYLESGQLLIAWGGGSNDCTNMANTQALSSDEVLISNLVFTDQSNTVLSTNVGYELTIELQGTRQEWQFAQTILGSVELRPTN